MIRKGEGVKDTRDKKMTLQAALDCNDVYTALHVLENIYPYVDIAELGTGLMISEGVKAIKELRKEYPDLKLLSDIKLMDGGAPLAQIALDAGADIVTVLGAADDNTIKGVASMAKKYEKQAFADLICVKDIKRRAMEIDTLGVDYIGVHTSYDLRNSVAAPLNDLRILKQSVKNAKISISGGITLASLDEILEEKPDNVIVGGGIINASDQRAIAEVIYRKIHQM